MSLGSFAHSGCDNMNKFIRDFEIDTWAHGVGFINLRTQIRTPDWLNAISLRSLVPESELSIVYFCPHFSITGTGFSMSPFRNYSTQLSVLEGEL